MPLPLALVRIEFTIEQSLLASYLVAPPFEYEDVGITSQILDPHRPPTLTDRAPPPYNTPPPHTARRALDHPAHRRDAVDCRRRPSHPLILVVLRVPASDPTVVAAHALGVQWPREPHAHAHAVAVERRRRRRWWRRRGGGGGGGRSSRRSGQSASEAAAAERLARLEAILHPLLTALDSFASSIERTSSAPAALDPRATMLLAVPIVLLAFASSFVLLPIWFLLQLVGGGANAVFTTILLAVILNALTIHQTEFYRWLGITGPHTDEEEYDEMERRGVTFADGISTG